MWRRAPAQGLPSIRSFKAISNTMLKSRHDVIQESRSEEHTSELQSQSNLVCRLLLEKKNEAPTVGWRRAFALGARSRPMLRDREAGRHRAYHPPRAARAPSLTLATGSTLRPVRTTAA